MKPEHLKLKKGKLYKTTKAKMIEIITQRFPLEEHGCLSLLTTTELIKLAYL